MKVSRFYWTNKRICRAAQEAEKAGNRAESMRLWALVPTTIAPKRSTANQRQRRKARRQRWANGDRAAFAR